MAEPTFGILNVVPKGRNMIASRTPRVQPSVPEEYAEFLSNEVEHGNWSVDPQNGEPLDSKGRTLQDHIEDTLRTRPHWLMPQVLEDAAETVWLGEPTLSARGERYRQLVKYHGNEKLADIAFREEAERYGVSNPFSLQPGSKPGNISRTTDPAKSAAPLSGNPWHPSYRGTPEEAEAEQVRLIGTGISRATSIAKAAGKTVFGKPLK
jgi:hypothetical protein